MDLALWTVEYVKVRDVIFKNLKDVREEKDHIIFTFVDKVHAYFIEPKLTKEALQRLTESEYQTFVCLNTPANLKFLQEHWNDIIPYPKVMLLFVNPIHGLKWGVCPASHHRIADAASLKQGLQTMAGTIPFIDE